MPNNNQPIDTQSLTVFLKKEAQLLGFEQLGITDTHLDSEAEHYQNWIKQHYHGQMSYMARNIDKRLNPTLLVPGTLSVIVLTMNYQMANPLSRENLHDPKRAIIARYTHGRDYHKVLRSRLKKLAQALEGKIGTFGYRVFTDSAPVLERALAKKAGLGWIGKNTCLIQPKYGSWCFIGEIFTDLPLPATGPEVEDQCGKCKACLRVCPTDAFVGPYQLDARRCIAYLTIEHKGRIDPELRPLIGNRIFGCDDCQFYCPKNRHAQATPIEDFSPRHSLNDIDLLSCLSWDEATFLAKTEGSAIRRIGHTIWLRNVAIALGNAPRDSKIIKALKLTYKQYDDPMLREHLQWAINEQEKAKEKSL